MSTVAIPYDTEPHPVTGMFNGKFGIWLFLASEVMLFGAFFSTYVLLRTGAPDGTWPKHGAEILNVPLACFNTIVLISSSVTMVMAWAKLKMNQLAKAQMFLLATFLLAGTFLVVKYFEYSEKFHHHQVWLNAPLTIDGHETTTVRGHLTKDSPAPIVDAKTGALSADGYIEITPDAAHGGQQEHGQPVRIEAGQVARFSNFGPRHSTFLATYFTMTGLHGLHILGGMVVILYFLLAGPSFAKKHYGKYTNRIECTGLYWHFVDLVWIFLFPVLYLL